MAFARALQTAAESGGIAARRLVQRACAGCREGEECESCRETMLQRRASPGLSDGGTGVRSGTASLIGRALAGQGRPMDRGTLRLMESRFRTSFADVRLNDGPASHAASRALRAEAFTCGQQVHFARGRYRPADRGGLHLLAHELAHTIQQRGAAPTALLSSGPAIDPPDSPLEREADLIADFVTASLARPPRPIAAAGVSNARAAPPPRIAAASFARPLVQRVSILESFSRLFFEGTFSDDELQRYLQYLDDHAAIEGSYDSDNKAREIIRRWRAGNPRYQPTLAQKQLMLLELIDGPTLDADEHAILELLKGSSEADVRALLATAGGEESLRGEFQGSELDELDAFLANWHADPRHRPVAAGEVGARKATVREVVVNQDTPQTVTVRYSDGRIESDICSTGKGTCCVEPGTDTGPTRTQTEVRDSNWTPIGSYRVMFTEANHNGIRWWTQFHPRAIALHEYEPVDGTPLSHGCVRLYAAIAERIYRGAVPRATVVRVTGSARPRCDHSLLKQEWDKDFTGGLPDDGEVDRELRKHLRLAFGVDGAELNNRIAARNIPRCGPLRAAARTGGRQP